MPAAALLQEAIQLPASVPATSKGDISSQMYTHGLAGLKLRYVQAYGCVQVSSVELEKACTSEVEEIVEAAAVAVPSPGGGPSRLALFLVLQPGASGQQAGAGCASGDSRLREHCQQAIRRRLNPLFKVSSYACCASGYMRLNAGHWCHASRIGSMQLALLMTYVNLSMALTPVQ